MRYQGLSKIYVDWNPKGDETDSGTKAKYFFKKSYERHQAIDF